MNSSLSRSERGLPGTEKRISEGLGCLKLMREAFTGSDEEFSFSELSYSFSRAASASRED